MRKLKTILQSRYLFKIIFIIFILYALLYTNLYKPKSIYKEGSINIDMMLYKYTINRDKLTLYLDGKEKLIGTYYIKTDKEYNYLKKNIELGQVIRLNGKLNTPSNNTVPNLFNYKKYLYNNHIHYLLSIDNLKIVSGNKSLLYYIKNKIVRRIDKIDHHGYLRTFIVGDKSILDKDVLNSYQVNGVSHLFSISGMHISLIASLLLYILKKNTYNNYLIYGVVISFLMFYLFLTNIGASILRATIMYILLSINKCFNLKIKSVDIMLLVLVIIIIIDPYLIYNIGLQFSYIISLTLILLSNRINNIHNKIKKSLYVSFVCFLISFPICIYNFNQVNFLGIFLNLVMVPLVSFFVFPLSIITFIFPSFYKLLLVFIKILEFINEMSSNINLFVLVLSKPNLILLAIYYLLIVGIFYNYKLSILFIIILLLHKNYLYFDNNFYVLVMDVGQGDSIIFRNKKKTVIIDTGGIVSYSNKKSYSISKSVTIPYLKSIGVNKVDSLILTHGDFDHMGESINLVNNFKVGKIIFNSDSYNELEIKLIKVLENKNIKYYKGLKELNISDNKLYFLNTKEDDNENDNSNVIYFKLNNYKFLFMGDAGVDREKDILDKYNLNDIDFIKIGHHGSDTSSSGYFIDSIKPKNCLISAGKNNRYGHPKESVLNILDDYCDIYRTDLNGSVEIKVNKNNYKIKTYSP